MSFSTFSTFNSNISAGIGGLVLNTDYKKLIKSVPPWATYNASSWDSATNTLTDLTGNGRNATTFSVTQGVASGNGATANISYLEGTKTSTITWPSGSIPITFTICSLTRYPNTINNGRILAGKTINWLHGHYNNTNSGVTSTGIAFYYDNFVSGGSNEPKTNWVNMCGTNSASVPFPNNILVNKIPSGTRNASSNTSSDILAININPFSETGDFQFSELIIFDTALTAAQMVIVSNAMDTFMNTGVLQ